jgi:hypothetical protein
VNPALLALAGAVAVAAVVAVSARDGRVTAIGLVAVLALGPLVADPFPDPLAVGARIAAAALAGFLLRVVQRDAPATRGSRIGWPAEAAGAGAAFVAGVGAHAFVGGDAGPAAALGAGAAVIAVAVAPLADGRDVLRLGIGSLLLVAGADLVRVALGGTPPALDELAVATVVVVVGACVALLVARTSQGGSAPDGVGLTSSAEDP